MEIRIGRLIDHVHLVVRDLEAAKRFYRAGAQALGPRLDLHEGPGFFSLDELFGLAPRPRGRFGDEGLQGLVDGLERVGADGGHGVGGRGRSGG